MSATACFASLIGSLFNFWSITLCATTSAKVWEKDVIFETGGKTAAPGLVVSTMPPNAWQAADKVSLFKTFAVAAINPKPKPGYIKALFP